MVLPPLIERESSSKNEICVIIYFPLCLSKTIYCIFFFLSVEHTKLFFVDNLLLDVLEQGYPVLFLETYLLRILAATLIKHTHLCNNYQVFLKILKGPIMLFQL